jgi:hypothetical protein
MAVLLGRSRLTARQVSRVTSAGDERVVGGCHHAGHELHVDGGGLGIEGASLGPTTAQACDRSWFEACLVVAQQLTRSDLVEERRHLVIGRTAVEDVALESLDRALRPLRATCQADLMSAQRGDGS